MLRLDDGDTRSVASTAAIRTGDVEALRRLLDALIRAIRDHAAAP